MAVTLYAAYEEWIGLVKRIHEAMQRLLELGRDSERLLSRLPKLLTAATVNLGSSCQCLYSLQILQTFLSSLSWSKGFVFPV